MEDMHSYSELLTSWATVFRIDTSIKSYEYWEANGRTEIGLGHFEEAKEMWKGIVGMGGGGEEKNE